MLPTTFYGNQKQPLKRGWLDEPGFFREKKQSSYTKTVVNSWDMLGSDKTTRKPVDGEG